MIYLHTGVRGAELRKMMWRQVNFKRRIITVGKSKTRGGEGREIPLNDEALEILVKWYSRFPAARPDHYVFPSERYLRHTFISDLGEAGVPESTMKAIAGRMSAKMLERYSHARHQAKQDAVNKFPLRRPNQSPLLPFGLMGPPKIPHTLPEQQQQKRVACEDNLFIIKW